MRFCLASAILTLAFDADALSFVPTTRSRSIVVFPPPASGWTFHPPQVKPKHQQQQQRQQHGPLVMKDDDAPAGNKFSLANLFSGDSSSSSAASITSGLRGVTTATLEPHPSKRDHINPLNALFPPIREALEKNNVVDGALPIHPNVRSGVLENGFSYVF